MTTPTQQLAAHLKENLGTLVYGLEEAIQGLTIALITGGHVLIQGVPGLGKTLLARSFARMLRGKFRRIQCTADLMPSDITGIHIYRADKGEFELVPGPVFANVLLVDEINRTGPKTQSALLQAMEEGTVTIDRTTYRLPEDFIVVASQNPIDFEGTYPLPESQIDRFLLRVDLSYLDSATEQKVLKAYDKPGAAGMADESGTAALPEGLVKLARNQVSEVHVSDPIYGYAVEIAAASRIHPHVSLGLSTRGSLNLMRCARVSAALEGAEFVRPDDIKAVAPMVISHRLVLTPDATLDGLEQGDIVANLLEQVKVPRE